MWEGKIRQIRMEVSIYDKWTLSHLKEVTGGSLWGKWKERDKDMTAFYKQQWATLSTTSFFFHLKWWAAFLMRVWNNNLFLLSERVAFHLAAESKPLWRMLLLPPLLLGNSILNVPDTANAIYDVLKMNKPNSWCNKWNTVGRNNWKKSLSHWIMMQDAFLLCAKMKPNIVDMSVTAVGAWAPVVLCWSLMKPAETWVGGAYLQNKT